MRTALKGFTVAIALFAFSSAALADEVIAPAEPTIIATNQVDQGAPPTTQENTPAANAEESVLVMAATPAENVVVMALAETPPAPIAVALADTSTTTVVTGAAAGSGPGLSGRDVGFGAVGAGIAWLIVHHHPLAWGWKALTTIVGAIAGVSVSKALP